MNIQTILAVSIFVALVMGGICRNIGRPKTRACPHCGSEISATVGVCRFCRRNVPPRSVIYLPSMIKFGLIGFAVTFVLISIASLLS